MSKVSKMQTVRIGLDIGASAIKVSYYNNKAELQDFSIRNTSSCDVRNAVEDVVVVDGVSVRIGCMEGDSNSESNKINYRYLYHMIGMVAYKLKTSLRIEGDIELEISTCLPPEQYRRCSYQYIELIEAMNGKTVIANGEVFKVNIDSVECGAEGIMQLYAFDIEKIVNGLNILLIDIGSSTSDFVVLKNDDDEYNIITAGTSMNGGWRMIKDVREDLLKDHPTCKFSARELEEYGKYQVKGKVYNVSDRASSATKVIKSMLIDIGECVSIDEHNVVITGRGANIVANNEYFKKQVGEFSVVEKDIMLYGNSRGCLEG